MGTRRKAEAKLKALVARGVREGASLERAAILSAIASGIFREEAEEVAGVLERSGAQAALSYIAASATLSAWASRWSVLTPILGRIMEEATLRTDRGEVPLARIGFNVKNPLIGEYLDSYTSKLAMTLSGTSYEKFRGVLRETMDEGLSISDSANRLRERIGEISQNRATLISRTETLNASRGAAQLQAERSGVVKGKQWLSAKDARVRPEHRALDGMEIALNEEFPGEGQTPSKPNCRCSLIYTIDAEALEGGAA